MSLFVIGDLHLCLCDPSKTMSVFPNWDNYQERIKENWVNTVKNEDTVVLVGDISWGISMQQAIPDLRFVNELLGQKIIIKGNHDYWWTTLKKMTSFFASKGLDSIKILHNNHFSYENYGICGTRGWVNMSGDAQNEKVMHRELQRLETSIKSAISEGLEPLVFMHYPPIFASNFNHDILKILYYYNIKECWYGHIHGRSAHKFCGMNTYCNINFHLISSDYIQFVPQKIC